MNMLLDLQDKLHTTVAALGRLESELLHDPLSLALESNILSLRKLQQKLQREFQRAADEFGLDAPRSRPPEPRRIPVANP